MQDVYKNYGLLMGHAINMSNQLMDSTIETTRIYWRKKQGLPEKYWSDPRPWRDCLNG